MVGTPPVEALNASQGHPCGNKRHAIAGPSLTPLQRKISGRRNFPLASGLFMCAKYLSGGPGGGERPRRAVPSALCVSCLVRFTPASPEGMGLSHARRRSPRREAGCLEPEAHSNGFDEGGRARFVYHPSTLVAQDSWRPSKPPRNDLKRGRLGQHMGLLHDPSRIDFFQINQGHVEEVLGLYTNRARPPSWEHTPASCHLPS
jgi:hypothetical protein